MRIFLAAALVIFGIGVSDRAMAQSADWPSLNTPSSVARSGSNDVALLVAIEDYAFLPDVAGAARNVADWERFLREDMGVPTILVLKDQQAVREEILDFADRAAKAGTPQGRLWFVFIGHGAPNQSADDGLLIGADGQQTMSSMMARSVSRTELMEALRSGEQQETIAIIDACFSGRDSDGNALAKGVQPVLPINAALVTPDQSVVMTAASANQVAGQLPGVERPAFSYLLLGAMRGWADDGDGIVTAQEANSFVRGELLAVPGRQQTPQLSGLSSMVLSRGATESRPSIVKADPVKEGPTVTGSTDEPTDEPLDHGQPERPFYAKVGVGLGGPGFLADPSVSVTSDLGVKLNGLTGLDSEVRVALWINYFSKKNDAALEGGDSVPTSEGNGEFQEVDPGDPVTSVRDHLLFVGLGPGYAWRSSQSVAYVDTNVGIANFLGGECTRWQADVLSRDAVCASSNDRNAFYVGARTGFSYSFLDVALIANFVPYEGVIGGLNLGFSFDP